MVEENPRVIALDIGEARIGVAVSDPLGITAQGVTVLKRASLEGDIQAIQDLALPYGAKKVVLGLPKHMNGSLGEAAHRVLEFGSRLEEAGFEVITFDERLTTLQAEQVLISADLSRKRRREVVDKTAACLILQAFLDRQRSLG